MTWVIQCDCGTPIKGTTKDEVAESAQEHAKSKHALTVTLEQARGLAEAE